jgi:nucleoside diphosphate kinase
MILGPEMVQVLAGENAALANREIMGATHPAEAARGTLRGNMLQVSTLTPFTVLMQLNQQHLKLLTASAQIKCALLIVLSVNQKGALSPCLFFVL